MSKVALCVSHQVFRVTKPKGVGQVYNGCNKVLVNGKPISLVNYSSTYADKVCNGSFKVLACGMAVGTFPGKCLQGYPLQGDPKIILD